jgi:hypothetical protein
MMKVHLLNRAESLRSRPLCSDSRTLQYIMEREGSLLCSILFTVCIFISVFIAKNIDKYIINSDVHNINTRQRFKLYYPTCKLTRVQKGVSYTGIRIFNNLPHSIKKLSQDLNKFKYSLKKFVQVGSFCSLDEYYEWKKRDDCV